MKTYAYHSIRQITLSIGDWVYLKLQPYKLNSLAKKRNEKLGPRFYGPYQIMKQIGLVAFELDLPPEQNMSGFPCFLTKESPSSNKQSTTSSTNVF